jgi:hypothetical protein
VKKVKEGYGFMHHCAVNCLSVCLSVSVLKRKKGKRKDQLQLFMVASERMKYILKQQTLKGPNLIQFEQGVVCKWLTLMRSEGKPVTEPMII